MIYYQNIYHFFWYIFVPWHISSYRRECVSWFFLWICYSIAKRRNISSLKKRIKNETYCIDQSLKVYDSWKSSMESITFLKMRSYISIAIIMRGKIDTLCHALYHSKLCIQIVSYEDLKETAYMTRKINDWS